MAGAIYWDTSALIKLYAPEPDSSEYLRLLIQQPEAIAISFLHRIELYFALRGKESRGEIAAGSATQLFQLVPLSAEDDLIDSLLEHNPKFRRMLKSRLKEKSVSVKDARKRI